eukprot:CAMPEP_0176296712 /NCGR_PEP_ID=MMETSP0121_2-20121125/58343_1 /TAXON_ID=160619 /ORGANISM="Kryptoperidinium foliaceum, Strain CCMP 1326" /LENGTH=224 /DNA_ID=CAMNT_0017637869 /DNA_START=25 /DNA_END=694 /DNA_ORIENTATION=-
MPRRLEAIRGSTLLGTRSPTQRPGSTNNRGLAGADPPAAPNPDVPTHLEKATANAASAPDAAAARRSAADCGGVEVVETPMVLFQVERFRREDRARACRCWRRHAAAAGAAAAADDAVARAATGAATEATAARVQTAAAVRGLFRRGRAGRDPRCVVLGVHAVLLLRGRLAIDKGPGRRRARERLVRGHVLAPRAALVPAAFVAAAKADHLLPYPAVRAGNQAP